MRKTLAILALLNLMLVAACGSAEEEKIEKTRARPVRVEKIQERDLPILVQAVGRLVPEREVVISAQVTGIVDKLKADVGDKVSSGKPLVELDATDYRLALNEAKANLQAVQARFSAAENRFNRARRLLPVKAITPELFDAAEAEYLASKAQVSQLQATVEIARQRLNKTVIKAPFDGHVTQKFVELGQNLTPGEPVMGIADMEAMRVRIHMNEQDYMHLDRDDPVRVKVEALPDRTFKGRVEKIGIQADARTNTFEVDILLENPEFILKAGLTARVTVQTTVIPNAIMIPQDSILFREDHKEVFVVENSGTAAPREVNLGHINGSDVQILQGLMPGDSLVVSGGPYLKEGDKVVVTP